MHSRCLMDILGFKGAVSRMAIEKQYNVYDLVWSADKNLKEIDK